jgi:hypothetical protein
MKLDAIQQFTKLRNSLVAEKSRLEQRLSQLDLVLGLSNGNGTGRTEGVARGRGRGRRGLSLKAAMIQATAKKALTKEEILAAVQKAGYKFATKRPLATLNAYLYQKGQFVRRDGRFTAANSVS